MRVAIYGRVSTGHQVEHQTIEQQLGWWLAKLRAGVLLPWTHPPHGDRLSLDRPRDRQGVTTDPAEAAVVAELFALCREPGVSLMQLAKHLQRRA